MRNSRRSAERNAGPSSTPSRRLPGVTSGVRSCGNSVSSPERDVGRGRRFQTDHAGWTETTPMARPYSSGTARVGGQDRVRAAGVKIESGAKSAVDPMKRQASLRTSRRTSHNSARRSRHHNGDGRTDVLGQGHHLHGTGRWFEAPGRTPPAGPAFPATTTMSSACMQSSVGSGRCGQRLAPDCGDTPGCSSAARTSTSTKP